jgi:Sulfatase
MKARGYFRHHTKEAMYSVRLIADLTLFRLAPMYLKEKIYRDGRWLLADTTLDGSSPWPDPVIREWVANLHVVDDRPVYKWYHFIGTHTPAKWAADCSLLPEPAQDRSDYVAQASCVLSSIAALLQVLKEAGIYDQTAFVISGDHGHNVRPDDLLPPPLNSGLLESLTGSARPALLVKQLNSREPLQFSPAPTHLLDVAPTALALVGIRGAAPSVFEFAPEQPRARVFQHYSIPDLWTGKPIPYVEYTVDGAVRDAGEWQVSGIQDYRATPARYEPLNKATGDGFVMGAHLRAPPDDDRSSWVTGRQLAFAIGIDDPASPHVLELRMHFPEWLAGQSFALEFNGGPSWQSPRLRSDGDEFWQTFTIPLDVSLQRSGRNFVSVVFERLEHPPDTDSWHGSALVESIRVTPVDQVRAHQ